MCSLLTHLQGLSTKHHVSIGNQCVAYVSCAMKHTKTETQDHQYTFHRISDSTAHAWWPG